LSEIHVSSSQPIFGSPKLSPPANRALLGQLRREESKENVPAAARPTGKSAKTYWAGEQEKGGDQESHRLSLDSD
jgi:hypothetical protein